MTKEPLFSVTKDKFELQFFRSGGKGGQYQNKTESGVRIIHKDSGSVGEAREERSQSANKRLAFNRLVKSKSFQSWLKMETARHDGILAKVEENVDKAMEPKNLKVEVKNENNIWVENNGLVA